jgi:hypothetical protein
LGIGSIVVRLYFVKPFIFLIVKLFLVVLDSFKRKIFSHCHIDYFARCSLFLLLLLLTVRPKLLLVTVSREQCSYAAVDNIAFLLYTFAAKTFLQYVEHCVQWLGMR